MVSVWRVSMDATITHLGTGTGSVMFTTHGIGIPGTGIPGIVLITMVDGIP